MKRALAAVLCAALLAGSMGCETVVKKFKRKPKNNSARIEEKVIVPQEYPSGPVNGVQAYQDAFLYWRSWHDELIDALQHSTNRKKFRDTIKEAVRNLNDMAALLSPDRKVQLQVYIGQLRELDARIDKDVYNNQIQRHVRTAETLRGKIADQFKYERIKGDML